jgi:hypothetical protein
MPAERCSCGEGRTGPARTGQRQPTDGARKGHRRTEGHKEQRGAVAKLIVTRCYLQSGVFFTLEHFTVGYIQ